MREGVREEGISTPSAGSEKPGGGSEGGWSRDWRMMCSGRGLVREIDKIGGTDWKGVEDRRGYRRLERQRSEVMILEEDTKEKTRALSPHHVFCRRAAIMTGIQRKMWVGYGELCKNK